MGPVGPVPPTYEDEGTKGFWSPKFCDQQDSNKVANSPNSWITYGVICVSCGYSEVCISFTVIFCCTLLGLGHLHNAITFTYRT